MKKLDKKSFLINVNILYTRVYLIRILEKVFRLNVKSVLIMELEIIKKFNQKSSNITSKKAIQGTNLINQYIKEGLNNVQIQG